VIRKENIMSWSNWISEDIGIEVNGAPAVSSWAEGRLDVFVRGTDNHLYHRVFENNQWQGANWEDLSGGNTIEQSPSAVSWGPNRIDLFAIWDKQLHHRAYQDGQWNPWAENLDGATEDAPASASWKMERVDVLVHTTDNFMSRRYWEKGKPGEMGSGWQMWENIGGQAKTIQSAPAAVATGLNRIDCFAVGSTDHLFHAWYQENTQNAWEEIDTLEINGAPALVSASNADRGRVDVFVRGTDDLLKHRIYYARLQDSQPGGDTVYIVQSGDWMAKIARKYNMPLDTLLALNPQVRPPQYTIHPGDKIIIAHNPPIPGSNGWEAGGSWENIGTNKLSSAPGAVGWWSPTNLLKRIDVFAQGDNNQLAHTWWT
jgi:LysM repeat protein